MRGYPKGPAKIIADEAHWDNILNSNPDTVFYVVVLSDIEIDADRFREFPLLSVKRKGRRTLDNVIEQNIVINSIGMEQVKKYQPIKFKFF
ncbi:hypothetical protein RCL1_003360 [Eukaryota sp. TZLM3-RCL]